MHNYTDNVFGTGRGTLNGWATKGEYEGAFMEPFMTTSLTLAVPGQRSPESSESEINEREPQQSEAERSV